MNILMYSNKCPACRNLLMLLNNEGFVQNFKLVCVDISPERYDPKMIVPMMIIKGMSKPLVANETFEWVQRAKFITHQESTKRVPLPPRGPLGYEAESMAGISDKFAFTEQDVPLPHSFVPANGDGTNSIFTAPEKTSKIGKETQKKLLQDIETRRKDQDTLFMKNS